MHLSPAARGAALRLLDEAPASATRADIGDNEKRRTLKEPVCIDEKWWRRRESNGGRKSLPVNDCVFHG
jgi:hypothetical protein